MDYPEQAQVEMLMRLKLEALRQLDVANSSMDARLGDLTRGGAMISLLAGVTSFNGGWGQRLILALILTILLVMLLESMKALLPQDTSAPGASNFDKAWYAHLVTDRAAASVSAIQSLYGSIDSHKSLNEQKSSALRRCLRLAQTQVGLLIGLEIWRAFSG